MRLFLNKLLFGGGIFFDLTKWVILLIVILSLIQTFWIGLFIVDGLSMEPNLHDKEVVLLQKNAYAGENNPERGDVVVVKYPGDPEHKKYVKRVVGLPGESVEISAGKVLIDNVRLNQNYLPVDVETDPDGNWFLGDKEYFLMGDNRPNSNDSRYFGAVEKRFITGKAVDIIYPRMRAL